MATINDYAVIEYNVLNTLAGFIQTVTNNEIEIVDLNSGGARPDSQYISLQLINVDEVGDSEIMTIDETGLRTVQYTYLGQIEVMCYKAINATIDANGNYIPLISPMARVKQIRAALNLPSTRYTLLTEKFFSVLSLGSANDRSTVMDDLSRELRTSFTIIFNYTIQETETVDIATTIVAGSDTTDPTVLEVYEEENKIVFNL